MPSEGEPVIHCFNRGCGQKYDPKLNSSDSCRYHPGAPFFHDAYKGWSCCNKKCTDFTEFLNIRGCTVSFHSNVKPPEPPKPEVDESLLDNAEPSLPERKPIAASTLERPDLGSPMTTLTPEIAASLQQSLKTSVVKSNDGASNLKDDSVVSLGTTCKNSGCNVSYEGPETNSLSCLHHPGYPVFHEGLKFWTCCQKRTSDFNTFLNQVGCESGSHVWIKAVHDSTNVNCRWDWHQTGSHVIVSVYAKQYCPKSSSVNLNPIRLAIQLVFPHQGNAEFNLDLELRGIVDVKQSMVSMFGSKVEIKLRKAEAGSWAKLEVPKQHVEAPPKVEPKVETLTPQIDAVDLSDL